MIRRITERFTPKQYFAELILGFIALFGLYLILGWSSYTALDNSWSTAGFQTESINKGGALAAWLIDFLFVFLGYTGNLIPFLTFFVPLYLLRTKAVRTLSSIRILLRGTGFIMLLIGLTLMATLLLSNTHYYASGGVLGGLLTIKLYPLLGKFGCVLLGFILTICGFILCSGASLIRLLVRFYYWLTMKNTDLESTQPIVSVDELEPIVIDKSINHTSVENIEQAISETFVPSAIHSQASINIEGLSELPLNNHSVTQQEAITVQTTDILGKQKAEQEGMEEKFNGFRLESEPLPQVTISVPLSDSQSAVDFNAVSSYYASTDEIMPKVSLSPSETTDSEPFRVKDNDELEQSDLTRQFELLEQQRLAEMEKRAKELNAEEALKVILADTKIPEQKTDGEKAEQSLKSVTYGSYGDTLIHPAFQQKTVKAEKPTTPLPSLELLEYRPTKAQEITREEIIETSQRIEQQLRNFNVKASVQDVLVGPVVTRYELELQPGIKASKVTSIDTDLARALMFRSIRVAEVIPGKPYIGIETPNVHRQTVPLRDVLDSEAFRQSTSLLSMALGKDISGKPVVVDLAKMPHLLVAGSTGSGKSVGVNTMILSLLFRVKPEQVKFIMIDPKVVELSIYNGIPHLLTEVVTDMKKAANALRWCVDEMERRYQLLSALRVRNIEGFNDKIDEYNSMGMPIPNPIWRPGDTMDTMPPPLEKLSYIVVIVDEFADLMMVAGKQIEELIARLAQKARAIGIHLILATQRPSVDVITGLIKANIPSRIAFTVASKIDSRTILDQTGAEALLGRGDMLYSGQGSSELIRVHGAFMSDDEVARVADDWRARGKPNYIDGILDSTEEDESDSGRAFDANDELDDLFDEVMEFVINTGTTSASSIQRKFKVGFNRAARIMDQLEEQGIVSPLQNGKREILARRPDY
ncbi:DNA translocase FtsK [Rodentibacter caecimuris]|uniref:DNA translocase FtsK n=1 Tax=Rodentibacter caecimuris TaxID=1796644 RepID=A0ABX3KVP1_9PAST|nr:cell division protein FtsK [Rodentibacter heylii]